MLFPECEARASSRRPAPHSVPWEPCLPGWPQTAALSPGVWMGSVNGRQGKKIRQRVKRKVGFQSPRSFVKSVTGCQQLWCAVAVRRASPCQSPLSLRHTAVPAGVFVLQTRARLCLIHSHFVLRRKCPRVPWWRVMCFLPGTQLSESYCSL